MRQLSVGLAFKYIYRLESPETTVWGRDIDKIDVGDLFSNSKDTLAIQEQIKHGISFDAGALYHFGFLRIGATARDFAGYIDGEAIERQFDLGVGYWIPHLMNRGLLERVIIAADIQNIAADKNFWLKTHLGAEANIPMGSLRLGLNQGYPSWGFGLNFWVLQIEFSSYSRELGEYPGHIEDHNYLMGFRIGF
jgi:hypothetical protein